MRDFLVALSIAALIVGVIVGLFWGIDTLVEYQLREQTAALENCIRSGYADSIYHSDTDLWLCIGVIDGKWQIKPVEDLDQ
jgi:hypothetical protein